MSVVLRTDPARAAALRAFVQAGGFRFEERATALYLARRPGITLTAYRSGKVLLTGAQEDEYAGVLIGQGLAERETPEAAPAHAAAAEPSLILNFDGACEPVNPGGVAAWGFLVRRDGALLHEACGLAAPPGPDSTNNIGEYRALIEGLRWLDANGLREEPLLVRGDSKLILSQVAGAWQVKAPRLLEPNREAKRLLARFPHARLEWVPRERNAEADELSKRGYHEAVRAHPEWDRPRPRAPPGPELPATAKQLQFLRDLGVEPPPGLTLREASRLLDEAMRRRDARSA